MAPELSRDQLKWVMLDEAQMNQDLGIPWGTAKELLPKTGPAELDHLVRQALLDLYDEGLVVFFRSTWNDGYSADPNRVTPLDRSELVSELYRDDWQVDPESDRIVFFTQTEVGASAHRSLPPGAIPRLPRGKIVSGRAPDGE